MRSTTHTELRTPLAAALLLAIAPLTAAADDLERNLDRPHGRATLRSGVEYSSGDYGSSLGDTNDWYVPLTAGYSREHWRFKLTIPYINSTGPGNVISSGGDTRVVIDEDRGACTRASVISPIVVVTNNSGPGSSNSGSGSSNSGSGSSNSGSGSGSSTTNNAGSGSGGANDCSVTATTSTITTPVTTTATRRTESGLGDVTASAIYSFDPAVAWAPYIDVGGKIKFPTADQDRGLGTGAYDYAVTFDLYKPTGDLALLGGLVYTFKGDIDPSSNNASGVKLDDTVAAYVGAEYRLNGQWLGGLSFDYKQASTAFAEDGLELSGYATFRVSKQVSVTTTFGGGFSNASPDFFAGLSLVYGFDTPF